MQTARMLAEDYDGHVRVVNNQRISGTLRYSAIEAIQQAKNGLSANEIGTWLEETRFDSSIYITVATLKYLKQGGRITPAAAPETGSSDPGRKTGRLLQSPHHEPGQKHHDQSHQR